MALILISDELASRELELLRREFPQYSFLSQKEAQDSCWDKTEIYYGSSLSKEQLLLAKNLRWIHCPYPYLHTICTDSIQEENKVLVSNTKGINTRQIGEYVIGAILLFAKQSLHWRKVQEDGTSPWEHGPPRPIWSLHNKTLLQVGLDAVGTEITEMARGLGLRIWGAQERRGYHPHCHKTFPLRDLHSILPSVDILCFSLPRGYRYDSLFDKTELDLLKKDSILIVVGSGGIIDEDALFEVAKTGKFRGIVLDAFATSKLSKCSPLWSLPDTLISPNVATHPRIEENQSFRTFRYNLRQFLYGNPYDMKNLIISPKRQLSS